MAINGQTTTEAAIDGNTHVVSSAFMVLRGKENGNVFWTTGGEYRTDWYELVFHSDNQDEVQQRCSKEFCGR